MRSQAQVSKYPRFRSRGNEEFELNLEGAQIPGVQFADTYLPYANFRGANLSGANFSGSILTNADFTDANLVNADFKGVDFTGASLINADLAKANLESAIFAGAVLRGAKLDGADFSGVDLREAKGLSAYQLLDAKFDDSSQATEELVKEMSELIEQRRKLWEQHSGAVEPSAWWPTKDS